MWIKRLKIGGWRSFSYERPLVLEDCGAVNLFMGPNNVGKSNVQRFIARLAQATEAKQNPLSHLNFTWGAPTPISLGLTSEDIHWGSPEPRVLAEIEYTQALLDPPPVLKGLVHEGAVHVTIEASSDDTTSDILHYRYPEFGHTVQNLTGRIWKLTNAQQSVIENQELSGSNDELLFLSELTVKTFCTSVRIVEPQRNRSTDSSKSKVSLSPSSISPELYALKNNDTVRWNAIHDIIRGWMGRVLGYEHPLIDFITPKDGTKLVTLLQRFTPSGNSPPPLPLTHFGTGVIEYFTLLSFLKLRADPSSPMMVFIDEIEAHLHPSATRELIKIIRENYPNIQLFLATHSTALLDMLESDWRLFRFSMPESATVVEPVETTATTLALIEDLGLRPTQLFLANSVVWVEGPSDVIYIRALLRHVAPRLVEGRDFSFLFYGGANIHHISYDDGEPSLVALLKCARNPVLICDRDYEDEDEDHDRLKPAVKRMRKEAETLGSKVFLTPGYEVESIMTPEALAQIVNPLLARKQKKNRGDLRANKVNLDQSLFKALREGIEPSDPKGSAEGIAKLLAGTGKVDIARGFDKLAQKDDASVFSASGLAWGQELAEELHRLSRGE